MKLALLAGNRFSPWHFNVFTQLGPEVQCTAFRAESEIQQRFDERGAAKLPFPVEPVYFDTQAGPLPSQLYAIAAERYRDRPPAILPFHKRLAGFDAILTWELFTEWTREALEAKRLFGIPVHVMVWDNIVFNNEDTLEKCETKARALREADSFIVHTERSRAMLLLEGVPAERICLLPPGVDVDLFTPGVGDRVALGLAQDEFVVLFVGWLLPRKGIDFLLQALRLWRDKGGPRIRLLIAGAGPGEERVRDLIQRLQLDDVCIMVGSRTYEEMPALFRCADLFVLPSIAAPTWQEQFGMALLEAMACGVPVLSTWSGSIPEMVGEAGTLCQPNDFVALQADMARLAEDASLRHELGEHGLERVRERFQLRAYAAGLRELLCAGSGLSTEEGGT